MRKEEAVILLIGSLILLIAAVWIFWGGGLEQIKDALGL